MSLNSPHLCTFNTADTFNTAEQARRSFNELLTLSFGQAHRLHQLLSTLLSLVYSRTPRPLPCRHVNLPGVHQPERGEGRRAFQLERVAVEPPGGHAHGGASGGSVHPPQGAARPAAHPVRAGAVQPGHLSGRAQPHVVRSPPAPPVICSNNTQSYNMWSNKHTLLSQSS